MQYGPVGQYGPVRQDWPVGQDEQDGQDGPVGWVGWANFTEKLMFALLTKKSIRIPRGTWGTYGPASKTTAGKKHRSASE